MITLHKSRIEPASEHNLIIRFEVRGEFIPLDQLLKAAHLVGSGGEAHAAVEAGLVSVDGRIESRKRAKLRAGQCVVFGRTTINLSDETLAE